MINKIDILNSDDDLIVSIDNEATDFVLDTADFGAIKAIHYSNNNVSQIGVKINATNLRERDITIVGWIVGETPEAISERKKLLNANINPMQMMKLRYLEYTIEFKAKETIKYSAKYKDNNDYMCKFQLSLECPYPLFKRENENKTLIANVVPTFRFPLTLKPEGITMGVKQNSLIANVRNRGSVEVGMRIVFRATGTVENPSIIKINDQTIFKIKKTLVSGETIEVISIANKIGVIGRLNGEELNYFKYIDLDNDWLKLSLGDNFLRYDAESNIDALEVDIYHQDEFLEVQE